MACQTRCMTYHAPLSRPSGFHAARPAYVAMTLRLSDPASDLLVRHVHLLRDCVALAQKRWGFTIEAAVVLPGELQLLAGFRDDTFAPGGVIRLIRSTFIRHLPLEMAQAWEGDAEIVEIAPSVIVLRRTFMEQAPVRAGLVRAAQDWPYSSAQRGNGQIAPLGVTVA